MCFTLTAVALLLSLYTVVFIKMSLGFNKGVSRHLFSVSEFAFMFQNAQGPGGVALQEGGGQGLRSQPRSCVRWH